MKLINQKAYLTMKECEAADVATENYLRKAKCEGVKCWDFIDDPADRRRALVGYDEMSQERKDKVVRLYGNPYDVVAREPILKMVVNCHKAHDYYMTYRYDGKALPPISVKKYTREASWLMFVLRMMADKRIVKQELGLTIPEFYKHTGELIAAEKVKGKWEGYAGVDMVSADFPSTYQRLWEKAKLYKERGYDMLIDPLFGNKIGAKLGKIDPNSENKEGAFAPERYEDQMAVIRYCGELGQNLDSGQIAKMANLVFEKKGWKTVSRATVNRIINENMHVLTAGRQGKRVHMSKVAMQNKRKAPPYPMLYWTLDGWTAELMYQERGPKGMEYKRLVVVLVLDPYNKYPVGYAIGERETPELIKAACRNAIMHTRELFGEVYQPLQLQSDNYQIKNLTPFYQAVKALYFTPAAVGNSKGKVVEPYFMRLNKICQERYKNWSGFNVDAKKDNQVNRDMLDAIKSQFPDRAGVVRQIEALIASERAASAGSVTRQEQYIARFGELPACDKKAMGAEDYLMVFGEALGRTNLITGQGVEKQIDGVEYTYDTYDPAFRANSHLDWQLYGDRDDLRKVLAVSPDGKMRFVLEQKRELPMDLYSTTKADVEERWKVQQYNNERLEEIAELYDNDALRTQRVLNGLEIGEADGKALQLMLTVNGQQKERLQDAKGLKPMAAIEQQRVATVAKAESENWEAKREEFLNGRMDYSSYV